NNAKVRFQLLCTLGDVVTPEAEQVRQKLLFKDINDKWVQIAALTASSSQSGSLLNYVLKNFKADVPAYGSLVQRLTNMVGSRGSEENIKKLIQQVSGAGNGKNG